MPRPPPHASRRTLSTPFTAFKVGGFISQTARTCSNKAFSDADVTSAADITIRLRLQAAQATAGLGVPVGGKTSASSPSGSSTRWWPQQCTLHTLFESRPHSNDLWVCGYHLQLPVPQFPQAYGALLHSGLPSEDSVRSRMDRNALGSC